MVISVVFNIIFMLDFCSYIFLKMSTALKKTHYYSSLMKLCHAVEYRPKSGNTTTLDLWTADAECSPGPIS